MTRSIDSPMTLRLAPLTMDHLDHVMSWVNDHEVLHYFANRQASITRDEEARYLQGLITSKTDRAYSIFSGDDYIGQCSINQIYWPAKNGRLFIVIRPQAQGQGHGSEAVSALLDLAWRELHLHKIWLIVRRENRNAQAMYLKLGFDFEGVLLDEYRVGNTYFDMVRMAIRNPNPDVA